MQNHGVTSSSAAPLLISLKMRGWNSWWKQLKASVSVLQAQTRRSALSSRCQRAAVKSLELRRPCLLCDEGALLITQFMCEEEELSAGRSSSQRQHRSRCSQSVSRSPENVYETLKTYLELQYVYKPYQVLKKEPIKMYLGPENVFKTWSRIRKCLWNLI